LGSYNVAQALQTGKRPHRLVLGAILLLTGLVAVLYSLLFWSNLSPWGRRRTVARHTVVEERPVQVVEERPVEVIEERPVEVVEERPLDDGLP
jgi:hypothetical protein